MFSRLMIIGLLVGLVGAMPLRAADEGHKGEAGAAHPAGEAHAAGDHEAAPSMPMDFQADLALWSLVTFLVFLAVLSKMAWRPLVDGLNAREAKIKQNIADAESNRLKAEAMLRDYEVKLAKAQDEVKAILAEARKDADTAKQDIIATAEKESTAMRQRAVADIDRARDNALGELFDFVSQNVMQATEQVVGRSLTGADQDRLVKEALASLDLRKN